MSIQLINTKNGTVEYTIVGHGVPLLFIHGGHSSCNETLFHKGFDTERYCLITPSRPGYGKTPLLNNRTPKDTAELFVALLDELKVQSVIVIGISAGGLSALELAANFPDRVTKLILISAVTRRWMSVSDKNYRRAKKLFSPSMEKLSWGLFRLLYRCFPKPMAKTMFKELSTHDSIDITTGEVSELFDMIKLQRSKNGFSNDLDQDIHPATIGNISCPTLILHSANDKTVAIEHAKHAHAGIKNSVLKVYNNNWGHLLWLGQESSISINDTLDFISHA